MLTCSSQDLLSPAMLLLQSDTKATLRAALKAKPQRRPQTLLNLCTLQSPYWEASTGKAGGPTQTWLNLRTVYRPLLGGFNMKGRMRGNTDLAELVDPV